MGPETISAASFNNGDYIVRIDEYKATAGQEQVMCTNTRTLKLDILVPAIEIF